MNREIQFYATLKTRWSKNRETRELVSICIKFIKEQRFYTRTGLNPYLARDIIKFSQNFRLIGIFLSLSLPLLRSDLESKLFGYIAKIQTKHREFHSIFPLKSNNSIILCCVNSSIPTIWLEKYCSFEFRFASRREGIQGIGITLTNWTLIDVLGGAEIYSNGTASVENRFRALLAESYTPSWKKEPIIMTYYLPLFLLLSRLY